MIEILDKIITELIPFEGVIYLFFIFMFLSIITCHKDMLNEFVMFHEIIPRLEKPVYIVQGNVLSVKSDSERQLEILKVSALGHIFEFSHNFYFSFDVKFSDLNVGDVIPLEVYIVKSDEGFYRKVVVYKEERPIKMYD